MLRPTTLADLLRSYSQTKFIKPTTLGTYWTTVHSFETACGGYALLPDLTEETVLAWLHEMNRIGRSAATIRKHRAALLMLWEFARDRGLASPVPKIPKPPNVRRIPTAWTIGEIGRILAACDAGIPKRRGLWTANHWRALTLVIFDTSLRVDCLLRVPRSAFSVETSSLTVRAEFQKDRADTRQRLHPQTVALLRSLPESALLFPWPLRSYRQIWKYWRRILHTAGLPMTRRDMFHKIRRSSYSYVFALCGPGAASVHAGHSRDLSASYLDPMLARQLIEAVDLLPRPKLD